MDRVRPREIRNVSICQSQDEFVLDHLDAVAAFLNPDVDRPNIFMKLPLGIEMQQQWKDAYPGITGKLLSWSMLAVGRDVEQGSYSALWALTSPKIEEQKLNGWYFNDPDTPGKESAQASDPQLGNALWDLSHRLIKDKLGEDALVAFRCLPVWVVNVCCENEECLWM